MTRHRVVEDGLARVRRRARFLPLLEAWSGGERDTGVRLAPGDTDLLTLVLEAASQRQALTVGLPSGTSMLPVLAALLLAADPVIASGSPLGTGPVVLVTTRTLRSAQLRGMHVEGVGFDPVGMRRLRGDGYITTLSGSSARGATPLDRLIVASPRAGLVSPQGIDQLSCVVVDASEETSPMLAVQAGAWAQQLDATAVIFTRVAGAPAAEWTMDWPYLVRLGADRPAELPRPSACELPVRVGVVDDRRVEGLFTAREILFRLREQHPDGWPPVLRNASRLARQLLSLCIPPEVYDAHTAATRARPIHQRVTELSEATARRDLPREFATFAETDWAGLKWALESAAAALEERNLKAHALGARLEAAVRAGDRLTVVCETRVEAEALETYLLRAGWAVPLQALVDQVRITSFSQQRAWVDAGRVLLTGLPPYRQRHRVTGGDVTGLELVCYAGEVSAVRGVLEREFNAVREDAAAARAATLRRLMGAEPADGAVGTAVTITVDTADVTPLPNTELASALTLTDRAESAALADPSAFNWLPGEDEVDADARASSDGATPVPVVAVLAKPGPVVLLLAAGGTVERVVEDRVLTVAAADLAAGMDIVLFPTKDRRGLFRRLAPHLDELRAPGTRLWLRVWREAHDAALRACESQPSRLAAEICRQGGDIKAQAVAEWGSPYRIGPAQPRHVGIVARIGGDRVAAQNFARIAEVMGGVRHLHRQVGRVVAEAARRHIAGGADALDVLERILGLAPAEVVAAEIDGLSAWRIVDVLGTGSAPTSALNRPLQPRAAGTLFIPEDT